jgi:hypothetical protein
LRWDGDVNEEPPVQKVRQPKGKSQVHWLDTTLNMVVMLPWEFKIATGDMNCEDTTATQFMLDPQQTIF